MRFEIYMFLASVCQEFSLRICFIFQTFSTKKKENLYCAINCQEKFSYHNFKELLHIFTSFLRQKSIEINEPVFLRVNIPIYL